MKLVIHPAVEAGAPGCPSRPRPPTPSGSTPPIRPARSRPCRGADALLGKITPPMLAAADRLRWVQTFTVSLEHYMFSELAAHPCVMTNMRGLFGDVIADQVMGYVLCFARNLHTYVRQQREHRYEPAGGESARVSNTVGPGTVNAMDRATIYLPDATMGVVGMGAIGSEIARRALAFGMSVRGVDRFPDRVTPPEGVEEIMGIGELPELLGWSDFVVIAAPQTPETTGWFNAEMLAHLRPSSYLINIGRGAIVVLDDLVAALRAGRLAGGGARRVRGRAAARRSPTLGLPQRHPDAAHRRLFAGHRHEAPGHAGRERRPARRGASR